MILNANMDRFNAKYWRTATFFREIAFEVDADPDAIMKYKNHSAITSLVLAGSESCLERVKTYEALSYGDPGVMMACPGASLAGLMVDELGDESQKKMFYQHVKTTRACTFLAVTEPLSGSNLSQINTRVTVEQDHYRLNGEKWLVGHGATGTAGVMIVKTGDGPLSVCAILLMPDDLNYAHRDGFSEMKRMVLPMVGLRGARLGRIVMRNVKLKKTNMLGSQRSVTERGMMALIKTFNRMRPCVGALALGVAQAVVDYVYAKKKTFSLDEKKIIRDLNLRISVSRDLLYQAATYVDVNPFDSGLSSLAKVRASRLAENVVDSACQLLGKLTLLEHHWIAKWYRDIWGFEYMEGTQNMHHMNITSSYGKGLIITE